VRCWLYQSQGKHEAPLKAKVVEKYEGGLEDKGWIGNEEQASQQPAGEPNNGRVD
jgi:hypothetical protein